MCLLVSGGIYKHSYKRQPLGLTIIVSPVLKGKAVGSSMLKWSLTALAYTVRSAAAASETIEIINEKKLSSCYKSHVNWRATKRFVDPIVLYCTLSMLWIEFCFLAGWRRKRRAFDRKDKESNLLIAAWFLTMLWNLWTDLRHQVLSILHHSWHLSRCPTRINTTNKYDLPLQGDFTKP